MAKYRVTMDYPVTIIVEAEDEEQAEELADFGPLDAAFGEVAGAWNAEVGMRYDDMEVEPEDD